MLNTWSKFFDIDQGLTPPFEPRKLPFLMKIFPSCTFVLQNARKFMKIRFL
jgi:hypothetical protein